MFRKKKLILVIILVFKFTISFSLDEILYKKNGVLITRTDIDLYKNYFIEIYGNNINTNQAIIDMVLIKNLIKKLNINNKAILESIDTKIVKLHGLDVNKNQIKLNILRLLFIKNELINEYFQNNLSIDDINETINKIPQKKLPLSLNNCLMIEKQIEINKIKNLDQKIFNRIKGSKDKIIFNENGFAYEVCIDNNFNNHFENEIFKKLENKTESSLLKLLYE